ncbi:hypothetical protein G9A89_013134 [Geosiphon pyriformis]|nr:hypothetical protein G9A89_013134 [Geosiphon pyriformis]
MLPSLSPKFFSNTSGGPKVFKPLFARSKSYVKAAVFVVSLVVAAVDMNLDLSDSPKTTTSMLFVVSSAPNISIESRLAFLESYLSKLSVLIKFLVELVGTLVVLVTKLLSTPPAVNVSVKKSMTGLVKQNKGLAVVVSMMQKRITHLKKKCKQTCLEDLLDDNNMSSSIKSNPNQTAKWISGMIKNSHELIKLANLQAQRWSAYKVNLIANIIQMMKERSISFKNSGYTCWMNFTRKYRQSDSGRISKWFKILEAILIKDKYKKIDVIQYKLRLKKKIEISTDGSLVKADFEDVRRAAALVTHEIEANFGIAVDSILLSIKTKTKAVLLALKAVPYKCKLILNTDREKRIDLNINKVAAHTKISKNKMANKLAKKATAFDTVGWAYNAKNISYILFCRKVELNLNIKHFLNQQTGFQAALD